MPIGRILRAMLIVGAVPLLANCDDNHCDNCNYTPYEISVGLVSGNFGNNGLPSLVSTSTVLYNGYYNAGNLKTYLPTTAGAYPAPTLTANGFDPLYLASADFNGDGLPDVASASYNDGVVRVFLNTAQTPGSWSAPIVLDSPGASQLAVADMTGDGLPDIVSADFNVSLFVQTAPGQFGTAVPLYTGGANWVAVGDLNGDGMPDIALTDAQGVKVLFHTGVASATTYSAPTVIFNQTPNSNVFGGNIIAIADVNADGLNDLIISDPGPTGGMNPTINVLIQDATHPGQFLAPVAYPVATHSLATSILITDLNGDGLPDIVLGGTAGVSVLLQATGSPGTFQAAVNYSAPYAGEIAVADVNGDGLPDIVVDSGPAQPLTMGVYPNVLGVLLQSASSPGTFGTLQALP